jgi:hypothetical protein
MLEGRPILCLVLLGRHIGALKKTLAGLLPAF